ncbi:fimbria/pilus periplasmic chaperone [Klebsiella aerogenes]|uniref:fimbria/pilus periplasmic chaperone n=1 Tax=Klebsiella aerogenes TaxID=548 RepID=UPI00378CE972
MNNRMTFNQKLLTTLCSGGLLAMTLVSSASAGGIALGATRVIYPQGAREVSLSLSNTSAKDVYLIQSWVANANGSKSADFVLTPPLFTMKPKKENTLRIMYTGPALPADRESVFYLNSKAIPSVDKNSLKGNTLQIATQSVIKLFVRPGALPSTSAEAPGNLTCRVADGRVTVTNPSPYYVSLVQFSVGGQKLPNAMVSPKSSLTVTVPGHKNGAVSFRTVNDYGANTAQQSCRA